MVTKVFWNDEDDSAFEEVVADNITTFFTAHCLFITGGAGMERLKPDHAFQPEFVQWSKEAAVAKAVSQLASWLHYHEDGLRRLKTHKICGHAPQHDQLNYFSQVVELDIAARHVEGRAAEAYWKKYREEHPEAAK
jgi:hypothetical protein